MDWNTMNEQNRQAFMEEVGELFSELETALLELEHNPDDGDLIGQIFRAMHTIKGNSGMFGYKGVSSYIHELETVYDRVRNGQIPVSRELVNLTLKAVDYAVEQLAGSDPDRLSDEERGRELISSLQGLIQVAPATFNTPLPQAGSVPIGRFIPTLTEYEMDRLRANLFKGRRVYCSRVTIPLSDLDREVTSLADRLKGDGELLSNIPHMEGVAGGSIGMLLLFASSREPGLLEKIVGTAPETVDCREVTAKRPAPGSDEAECKAEEGGGTGTGADGIPSDRHGIVLDLSRQESAGPAAVETAPALSDPEDSAEKERGVLHGGDGESEGVEDIEFVRVPAERLDRLVDLVGELVTLQGRIRQIAVANREAELEGVAEGMDRLTEELRDLSLNLRMLPIGVVFARLREAALVMAKELGKEVVMTTSGDDTELDKGVMDRLNAPLAHLIRNIIEYGIEPPAVRTAAGKPRHGTLRLTASISGESVLVKMADDGGGLDREAIRAAAAKKGLIPADTPLTEREIFDLISAPGLLAGDGIAVVPEIGGGTDSARGGIDLLQGNVEIDSRPGMGTTITARIPLNQTIVEGLLVKVGEGRFVIPLRIVDECVEISGRESAGVDGLGMTMVRGRMIPCIRLREEFSVPGEPPDIQQIILSDAGGTRVGLVVDQVMGEHRAVIKPLGRMFKGVRGVSGTSILGDGVVAMVIDLPELVRAAEGRGK